MVDSFSHTIPASLKKTLDESPLIIGIGPTAWPRVISAYYFPKFQILCHNDCQDNELIEGAGVKIFSLKQNDPFTEVYPVTPGRIIDNQLSQKFLSSLKEPFVFQIYKSYPLFEKICAERGWRFLGNTIEVKNQYEDKRIFKEVLREIGVETIPGENIPIEELTEEKFTKYQEEFNSKKIVLQIAEATWGGGVGTFFLDNPGELVKFHNRVKELRGNLEGKKKELKTVNVAPFIEGTSASIPCCTTKFGVLTGSIQTQILDIPELGAKLDNRSGVFVGHDWAYKHYSKESNEQASWIARRFGDYLYKKGYKGIFGLDLIVDKNGKVWPVECNPRETDAFPVVCMLQMEAGTVPMQVFHNLEHLGIDYKIDFDEIDQSYKKDFKAAQVLIYNKTADHLIDRKTLKAGIYKVKDGKLEFVRSGFATWDLKDESEFLLTEDISKEPGNVYSPHERIFRLIRKASVLNEDASLKREVAEIADLIYEAIDMVKVDYGLVDRHGLKILFSSKLKSAIANSNFENLDLINILRKTKGGLYRPANIVWRKKIDKNTPILKQIKSKRSQKQITADIKKIADQAITIEIREDIDNKLYKEWLDLYERIISGKEKGHVVIDDKWLDEKKEKGKKVSAVLAYKNGNLIGGELFFEMNKVLGIGYGVSEKIDGLYGGLGLLMDYYFIEHAQKKGYEEVSFGQDTNLYGHDLSVGLILYKAKLGFTPHLSKKTYWLSTYLKNLEKIEGELMFFGGDFKNLNSLIVVTGDREKDYQAYLPEGFELKIIDKDSILAEHRNIFEENRNSKS